MKWLAVIFVGVIACLALIGSQEPAKPVRSSQPKQANAESPPKQHADDGKQEQRLALIAKLQSKGLIAKHGYGGGSLPKVWVNPSFLLLDSKAQNKFLEVVYAYYEIEDDTFGVHRDSPLFRDGLQVRVDNGSALGQRVGDYDPLEGLSR